jgi:hypothetical protein
MTKPPLPSHEVQRLAALRELDILDTPPEKELDDLTALAATICGTPIALVSLIDAHRHWFKSRIGTETNEARRKKVGKRTGLGLSIISTIVTNHHGKIDVHSSLGQGTTFFIDLPVGEIASCTSRSAAA